MRVANKYISESESESEYEVIQSRGMIISTLSST